MKNDFQIIQGEILDEITPSMEKAGFDDRDIMAIRAVACYEGVNNNKALFEKEDLERAVNSFVDKPLFIVFKNGNPTGHGYDRYTKTFSELRRAIGVITWAYGQENEDTGRYEVVVEIAMWQKYYPEIASRLRELHANGELNFSIEADRDYTITEEGYRKCYNILFRGLCVVQNPSFEDAKSLMVAELLKNDNKGGNSKMNEKQFNQLLEAVKGSGLSKELASQITELASDLKTKVSDLEKTKNELSEELAFVKEEKAELEGELKEVKAERDKFKSEVEKAEKEKLGQERLEKLSKYGEVTETAEELAELSKEDYLAKLEEAVINYKPSGIETAEDEEDVKGITFEKGKKKANRRSQLLSMMKGFDKAL